MIILIYFQMTIDLVFDCCYHSFFIQKPEHG
jgi:hypothetical protein